MPRLPVPTDRLAVDPKLRSADDVRRALEEISWIDAEAARLQAECQREVSGLKARYESLMVVDVERAEVALADRRAALALAVETYCDKARDRLLDGEAKSREFTHGRIGWRTSPAKIEFSPKRNEASLLEWADKACKLVAKVRDALAKCFPFAKLSGDVLFDVKITLNKARAKKARETNQLGDKQLREMGLAYKPGEESFYIEVNDYPVQREAGT